MPDAVCLDTNILIYAAVGRKDTPAKWAAAHALLEKNEATISAQALAEFYAIATGPKYSLDWRKANFWMERLAMLPLVELDAAIVLEGVALSQRYRIAYWDGAILAASHRCGARILYTEDLNHNQVYGAVRVVNPFL